MYFAVQQSPHKPEFCMWKAALVGALALTTMGSFVSAQDLANNSAQGGQRYTLQSAGNGEVESKIAQAKATLRLTPEQERHWPRVEVALREVSARKNNVEEASAGGFVQKMSARAGEFVLSASAVKRLVSAAQPLIKSLDEDQKRSALSMARSMGLASVAARFE
jgi:zinc resistance-associated protein